MERTHNPYFKIEFMFHLPEKYRIKNHPLYPPKESGEAGAGAFLLPINGISPIRLFCIASSGSGWEHVSVTLYNIMSKAAVSRTPTWGEMCIVKDAFWDEEDYAVQFHPSKDEYVNYHPFCLHLWRPTDYEIKRPSTVFIGPK